MKKMIFDPSKVQTPVAVLKVARHQMLPGFVPASDNEVPGRSFHTGH